MHCNAYISQSLRGFLNKHYFCFWICFSHLQKHFNFIHFTGKKLVLKNSSRRAFLLQCVARNSFVPWCWMPLRNTNMCPLTYVCSSSSIFYPNITILMRTCSLLALLGWVGYICRAVQNEVCLWYVGVVYVISRTVDHGTIGWVWFNSIGVCLWVWSIVLVDSRMGYMSVGVVGL